MPSQRYRKTPRAGGCLLACLLLATPGITGHAQVYQLPYAESLKAEPPPRPQEALRSRTTMKRPEVLPNQSIDREALQAHIRIRQEIRASLRAGNTTEALQKAETYYRSSGEQADLPLACASRLAVEANSMRREGEDPELVAQIGENLEGYLENVLSAESALLTPPGLLRRNGAPPKAQERLEKRLEAIAEIREELLNDPVGAESIFQQLQTMNPRSDRARWGLQKLQERASRLREKSASFPASSNTATMRSTSADARLDRILQLANTLNARNHAATE